MKRDRGKLRRAGTLFLVGVLLCSACTGPSRPAAAPLTAQATQTAAPTSMPPTAPVPPTLPPPSPSPVATAPVPAATAESVDWVAVAQSGDLFIVLFDETRDNFDDSTYSGDWQNDPLGTLKGGYAYRVRFSPAAGWVTSGYNQAAGEIITAAYPAGCGLPAERQLCLWGALFTFDEQGQVFAAIHGLVGHLQTSPQPSAASAPAVSVAAEIETALWDYTRIRKEAEETLNPSLLAEVCIDPYLSWKTARIQENIRDGSHWGTPSAHFTVTSFVQPTADTAVVRVSKLETKLFYPQGSSIPDDEACAEAISSYRDCAYEIEYRMVRSRGRWYVSEATALGDCPGRCQATAATFPSEAITPAGWPALPTDLYFLRDGRLWRWPADGAGLQGLTPAGGDAVQDYALSPDGQFIAYTTVPGALYAMDATAGEPVFPADEAAPPAVREYALLAESRLLYVTMGGGLYVVDLAAGVQVVPPVRGRVAAIQGFSLAGEGRYLAYATTGGELYAVDLESGTPVQVPVEEPLVQFALTPDGQTMVYLTRHEFSSQRGSIEVYSGTLFAAAVGGAGQPVVLGACPARAGRVYSCQGFALSPDGQRVLYQDRQGIWVARVPAGEPRLLAVSSDPEESGIFCGLKSIGGWLANSRHMAMKIGCYEGSGLAVIDTETGVQWPEDDRGIGWCYMDCYRFAVSSPEGLWLNDVPASLRLLSPQPDGMVTITRVISQTAAGPLWPTHLLPLPGGRLALAHQRCQPADGLGSPDQPPGLFIVEADGTLREGAALPRFPCSTPYGYDIPFPAEIENSTVIWQADGAAFLYVDWRGWAMLLGTLDGSTLWDVRQVLLGATGLQWGR